MLILSRRVGETVCIGHGITVTVTGLLGDQVRIGIDAPRELPVHRKEVYDRIQAGCQDRKAVTRQRRRA